MTKKRQNAENSVTKEGRDLAARKSEKRCKRKEGAHTEKLRGAEEGRKKVQHAARSQFIITTRSRDYRFPGAVNSLREGR
jgi:hypothetical protein